MINHKKAARTLAVLAFAAGLSTAALASDSQISVSAKHEYANTKVASVNLADLDLTQAHGQALLRARLASAVQDVCTFPTNHQSRTSVDVGCTGDAAAQANKQADAIIAMAGSHQAAASGSAAMVHGAN